MGVDCRLLVVDGNCGTWGYSHTMLSLERDYDLWTAIEAQKPQLRPCFDLKSFCGHVPDGSHKDEHGYGDTSETPYGEPLRFLTSQQVSSAFTSVNSGLGKFNQACAAFVAAIPRDTLIGIYWH